MKRTISNPYKVSHKMYLCIISISLVTLILSLIIPNNNCSFLISLLAVIKNLSYGCIASTIVAWMIDCVNTKNANKKANNIYDSIYRDLKYHIGDFISTWADLCAVSFKDKDYCNEKNKWMDWYRFVKEKYDAEYPEKQHHLLDVFRKQLLESAQYVNISLERITSQSSMLTINDAMNSDLRQIISDFKFEFHALDLDLSFDNYEKYFWDHIETIMTDLENYINNWSDIKCYNYVSFRPFKFFETTDDWIKAIVEAESIEVINR